MISPSKCKNCGTCESVCPNSAVDVIYFKEAKVAVPVMCMQCEDASSIKVCPTGALHRAEDNTVRVYSFKCIGCRVCLHSCPRGNIYYRPRQKQIQKCDLCDGSPLCEKYCPTRAIEFVDDTASNRVKKTALAAKFKELFVEEGGQSNA